MTEAEQIVADHLRRLLPLRLVVKAGKRGRRIIYDLGAWLRERKEGA